MSTNIAINGMGRIGRMVLKLHYIMKILMWLRLMQAIHETI